MRSRLREWLSLAVAVLLLAGCAAVPTSGPVREHDFGNEPADSRVQVAPLPPTQGASMMLIVEGFLHAMGTDQVGYPVARQYLTEAADEAWRPESGASVYADGYPPGETAATDEAEASVVLSAPRLGTLSRRGEYQEAAGQLRHDFGLVKDGNDQWRISDPPDGVLISRYHFTTNYAALNLHFMDLTGTALVPDPRFFPQNDALLVTLLRAQLAGPGAWLRPAVQSSALVADADRAEITSQGIASVSFGSAVAQLGEDARRNLLAELTQTLSQFTEVTGVQVSAGGTPLTLPDVTETVFTPQSFPALAPAGPIGPGRLFVAREGGVQLVDSGANWTDGGPMAPGIVGASAIAVRGDLAEVAAITAEGTRLTTASLMGETATDLLEGTAWLRPDYSRQQELWAIDKGLDASGFQVFAADYTPLALTVSGMPSEPVGAFRISPDGTRMALVVQGADTDRFGIARIVRDQDRVRLEEFREVSVSASTEVRHRIVDTGWTSATELLALVVQGGGAVSVIRVDQNSARIDDIGPSETAGLLELAVVPERQAVARNEEGALRYESDFNWKAIAVPVEAVAYSG